MSVENIVNEMNTKLDDHIGQSRSMEQRMGKLETQMDRLTDAVVKIARAEEKISLLVEDTKEMKHDVRETKNRVNELEMTVVKNTTDLGSISKIIWLVGSTVTVMLVGALITLVTIPQ
jgi:predicted nuclease with TOPRIM domain